MGHLTGRSPPQTPAQPLPLRRRSSQTVRVCGVVQVPTLGPTFAVRARMRPATRILIVDDEANARNALAELLHDEGYEVATAGDGAAARARIAELHPDLVLSDVQLPGLDGVALHDAAGHDGPAFVLMSARPRPRGLVAPFVHKPIQIDELVATIEGALAGR